MKKYIIDECYQVFGYDEYYTEIDESLICYDKKWAEDIAESYVRSGKYVYVILRKFMDWRYREEE